LPLRYFSVSLFLDFSILGTTPAGVVHNRGKDWCKFKKCKHIR